MRHPDTSSRLFFWAESVLSCIISHAMDQLPSVSLYLTPTATRSPESLQAP